MNEFQIRTNVGRAGIKKERSHEKIKTKGKFCEISERARKIHYSYAYMYIYKYI
jgi:hypothetical protein